MLPRTSAVTESSQRRLRASSFPLLRQTSQHKVRVMLVVVGSTPMADQVADHLGSDVRVVRVPLPDGGSAEPRIAALKQAVAGAAVLAATGEDERSLLI